jgi:peptide/nickel transport system permease protein
MLTPAGQKDFPRCKLLIKYPVRHALNPLVSTLGWALPGFIGGEALVSIVLNLPTSGPIFLNSLFNQDMYLAAGFVLMFSVLTVIGTFISDITTRLSRSARSHAVGRLGDNDDY